MFAAAVARTAMTARNAVMVEAVVAALTAVGVVVATIALTIAAAVAVTFASHYYRPQTASSVECAKVEMFKKNFR